MQKDDNTTTLEPAQSRTQLITAKNWISTGYTKDGVDLWPKTANCQKDDISVFIADGTFVYDSGTIKCDPNEPQQFFFTWKFINNDNKIVMDNTDTSDVVELTATKLVLRDEHIGIVYISTYTAQ